MTDQIEVDDDASTVASQLVLGVRGQQPMTSSLDCVQAARCEDAHYALSHGLKTAQALGYEFQGWRFGVFAFRHGNVEHWGLFACPGPDATPAADTQMAAAVVGFTDAPLKGVYSYASSMTVADDRLRHWRWHSDGSPLSQDALAATAATYGFAATEWKEMGSTE